MIWELVQTVFRRIINEKLLLVYITISFKIIIRDKFVVIFTHTYLFFI